MNQENEKIFIVQLSFWQRFVNPPGATRLWVTLTTLVFVILKEGGKADDFIQIGISACFIATLLGLGTFRAVRCKHIKTQYIRVKKDAISISSPENPNQEWIRRELFQRSKKDLIPVRVGFFGCRIISMMSGHWITLTKEIVTTREFQDFVRSH